MIDLDLSAPVRPGDCPVCARPVSDPAGCESIDVNGARMHVRPLAPDDAPTEELVFPAGYISPEFSRIREMGMYPPRIQRAPRPHPGEHCDSCDRPMRRCLC